MFTYTNEYESTSIFIHIFIYVYVYIYTHIYTYTHIHIYTYTHSHIHIYTYIHSGEIGGKVCWRAKRGCSEKTPCMRLWICLRIYIHIDIYAYIHIHIYTYNSSWSKWWQICVANGTRILKEKEKRTRCVYDLEFARVYKHVCISIYA